MSILFFIASVLSLIYGLAGLFSSFLSFKDAYKERLKHVSQNTSNRPRKELNNSTSIYCGEVIMEDGQHIETISNIKLKKHNKQKENIKDGIVSLFFGVAFMFIYVKFGAPIVIAASVNLFTVIMSFLATLSAQTIALSGVLIFSVINVFMSIL